MAIKTTVKSLAPVCSGGTLLLDKSNPFIQGLQSAMVAGSPVDLVNGYPIAAKKRATGKYGEAYKFEAADADAFTGRLSPAYFTDSVTVVAVAELNGYSNYPMIYSSGTGNYSGVRGFDLRYHVTIGWPSFTVDTPTAGATALVGTDLKGTGPHTLAGTYDGTNVKVYYDTTGNTGSGTTSGIITDVSTTPTIGNRADASYPMDGSIYLILVWNRCLRESELDSILRDPWQVVTRSSRRPYFPAEASAPSANTTLTGATASASAGTLSAATTRISTTTLTGATASGAAGTLTAAAQVAASTTLTGATASGSAGTLSAAGVQSGTIAVQLTGATASGAAGTLVAATTNIAAIALTGASASASAGTLSAAAGAVASTTIALTGATASGAAGTLTVSLGGRYGRPQSDISVGSWLPSTGSDLFDMVDETVASDTDYVYATSATTCELKLSATTDPLTSNNQVVRYRAWSSTGSTLKVHLYQGATLIATWTRVLTATETTYEEALSALQCDAITDYTDLRLKLESV